MESGEDQPVVEAATESPITEKSLLSISADKTGQSKENVVPDLDDIELHVPDDENYNSNDEQAEVNEEEVEEEEEEEDPNAEYITMDPVFIRARELFLSCDVTPAEVRLNK